MLKWAADARLRKLHQRRRKACIAFLDDNLYNERYCPAWFMYALLDEKELSGDVSDLIDDNLGELLLFMTYRFLEGW